MDVVGLGIILFFVVYFWLMRRWASDLGKHNDRVRERERTEGRQDVWLATRDSRGVDMDRGM